MEKYLNEKKEAKDGEHGNGKDCPWWKESILIASSQCVEEKKNELLKKQRDHDTIDSTTMDVLVDFRSLVSKVNIVSVNTVFHDHVEQTKRCDEWSYD